MEAKLIGQYHRLYRGATQASRRTMAKFTTRIQLDGNPSAEDYANLHKAMKRRGFTRIIASHTGARYWLPHAEYNREGDVTRAAVLGDAKSAALTVSADFQVLVTESAGRSWYGLETATATDAVLN